MLFTLFFFFFNDTATTEIYTLSLHDALPISPRRLAQVGDVEDRELRPERAPLLVRVLADAEKQVLADRVQVGRVARDLQRAEHARALGQREVEGVERVDLAEGDDVAGVADEAHRVDALALPKPADPAGLDEGAARLAQRRQERLGLAAGAPPGRALGADDAEHAAVLGERPLAE